MSKRETPPFAIGSGEWPGAAKIAEEAGEILQLIGKLMAYPDGDHPDGKGPIAERLGDELGDLRAAIDYFASANGYSAEVEQRAFEKLDRFNLWHMDERDRAA